MNQTPRVALFCETFHEINGVALTVRQLVAFAKRNDRPFLVVHSGAEKSVSREGCVQHLQLPRGPISFPIESDLRYDLVFWRHLDYVRDKLLEFRPDIIHVTSPGEFGQLGAYLSHTMRIPLVASWHTNFHQFGARRLQKMVSFLPDSWGEKTRAWAERSALVPLLRFYRIARATLAPTPEQVAWLESSTHRPCFLMPRGVDSEQFHPQYRTLDDGVLRLGYVGRVTPEKGVRFLVEIEKTLLEAGINNFSIMVVGEGSEKSWLQKNLLHGVFPGVLREHKLAEAYANMDLFVFPSRTDTFGNVIQEAAASGVAAIVTSEGGPRNLVAPGSTGFIAADDAEFLQRVVQLAGSREKLRELGRAARERIVGTSWDAAFDMTYHAYRHCHQYALRGDRANPVLVSPRLPAA